jgi:hypothetical protein
MLLLLQRDTDISFAPQIIIVSSITRTPVRQETAEGYGRARSSRSPPQLGHPVQRDARNASHWLREKGFQIVEYYTDKFVCSEEQALLFRGECVCGGGGGRPVFVGEILDFNAGHASLEGVRR